MPLQSLCCSSGALVLSAVVTLLLLPPPPFLVPSFLKNQDDFDKSSVIDIVDIASPTNPFTFEYFRSNYASLDFYPNIIMLIVGITVYLLELIHRKLMERRILKLRQLLSTSMERLRAAEQQQEQLEATLRLVRSATTEYNLLLYLLLRWRRPASSAAAPQPQDKDDITSLFVPPLDV